MLGNRNQFWADHLRGVSYPARTLFLQVRFEVSGKESQNRLYWTRDLTFSGFLVRVVLFPFISERTDVDEKKITFSCTCVFFVPVGHSNEHLRPNRDD